MIPLFKSHFSIGKSILRIDDILSLTKDLEKVYLVEDSMTGFPEAFRKLNERLCFGLRFSLYNEDQLGGMIRNLDYWLKENFERLYK